MNAPRLGAFLLLIGLCVPFADAVWDCFLWTDFSCRVVECRGRVRVFPMAAIGIVFVFGFMISVVAFVVVATKEPGNASRKAAGAGSTRRRWKGRKGLAAQRVARADAVVDSIKPSPRSDAAHVRQSVGDAPATPHDQ